MYKALKIGKFRFTVNSFPRSAKKITSVDCYKTGFHYWDSFEDKNYSLTIGLYRVIISIDHPYGCSES